MYNCIENFSASDMKTLKDLLAMNNSGLFDFKAHKIYRLLAPQLESGVMDAESAKEMLAIVERYANYYSGTTAQIYSALAFKLKHEILLALDAEGTLKASSDDNGSGAASDAGNAEEKQ